MPPPEDTTTLLVLKEEASFVGAKLIVARTPEPAGNTVPAISKPITIPVDSLYVAPARSEATPVT